MQKKASISISVVIPVKDRFELASICIYSILNQKQKINELVVIDDYSSIPVEAVLATELQHAKNLGINVISIRNLYCQGVSRSRNTGVRLSSSEVVCFCDSDDYWLPQKTYLVSTLMENKDISVLFHSFYWDFNRLLMFRIMPFGCLSIIPRPLIILFSFLNSSCCSIRKSAVEIEFHPEMKYHEDLEYFLRISKIQKIWLFNFPLTFMGRIPGSNGGASSEILNMRKGAIDALKQNITISFDGLLAACKTIYHYIMLFVCR